MSKFKSEEELLEYLKNGGVVKPKEILPQAYQYARFNEYGRLTFMNGHNASHLLLTIGYWEKAESHADKMIIDSFARVLGELTQTRKDGKRHPSSSRSPSHTD